MICVKFVLPTKLLRFGCWNGCLEASTSASSLQLHRSQQQQLRTTKAGSFLRLPHVLLDCCWYVRDASGVCLGFQQVRSGCLLCLRVGLPQHGLRLLVHLAAATSVARAAAHKFVLSLSSGEVVWCSILAKVQDGCWTSVLHGHEGDTTVDVAETPQASPFLEAPGKQFHQPGPSSVSSSLAPRGRVLTSQTLVVR